MPASPFALMRVQRAVLEAIREEHPDLMADLRAWLAVVIDDLTLTAQGRVVTEPEAGELLGRLRVEAVARMRTKMEPWGEDEDLRETVIESPRGISWPMLAPDLYCASSRRSETEIGS